MSIVSTEVPAPPRPAPSYTIREARDDDSWDLIALVAACWAQYPGCVLEVHTENPDLLAPATYFAERGGRLWVAEANGHVLGCMGVYPSQDIEGWARGRRLYVAPRLRGVGLGRRFLRLVEDEARRLGVSHVELWSDTRLLHSHRLYESYGFVRREQRTLDDVSRSSEYHFVMALGPGPR